MRRYASAAVCAMAAIAAPPLSAAWPPMSYLATFGAAGNPVTRLGWGLGMVSIAVMVVIAVLLVWGLLRRRPPAGSRELTVKTDSGGMPWIYVGVGVSTLVLVFCATWTMFTVAAVAMPARAEQLTVQITASQWWWAARYRNTDPSQIFTTANELHIPVGSPVRFELSSIDVIHSFWIPQLGGKMDVIPGQTNATWLQADQAGRYRGQCGEFCGAQHAHMALWIVADEPAAYATWASAQVRLAAAPSTDAAQRGQQVFLAHCSVCHAVRGTPAGGILGPDLTHLMSRDTLAAGLLPNTRGNLAAWIANSQALKPGSRMPSLALSGPELGAVLAYLDTLQ